MRIIIKVKSQKSKVKIIGLGAVAVGVAAVLVYSQAGAQVARPTPQPTRFSYAAKFICGVQSNVNVNRDEPPVKRGNYATAVNIHNPQASEVKIFKKIVLALPEPDQGTPGQKVRHILKPGGAMEVDCREINQLNGTPGDAKFKKGFLVIESNVELDVVGVYTANTNPSLESASQAAGMTMDVEYIPGRRVFNLQPPTLEPPSDEQAQ